MSGDFYIVDVIEFQDGSCESVIGKDGTSEVFFVPSSEKTIARYRATCKVCGKREWHKIPKAERCDCDVFMDWNCNITKRLKQ